MERINMVAHIPVWSNLERRLHLLPTFALYLLLQYLWAVMKWLLACPSRSKTRNMRSISSSTTSLHWQRAVERWSPLLISSMKRVPNACSSRNKRFSKLKKHCPKWRTNCLNDGKMKIQEDISQQPIKIASLFLRTCLLE